MSSPRIKAIWVTKSPFIPCKLEIILISHTSVSLYLKVDSSMTNAKKALTFQHNKMALASANLDQCVGLLTLANRLNLILMATSGLTNWERKLSRNWANFQYLMILSWHNAKGDVIVDTTSANNPSILKPIQDGKKDGCCSTGICVTM
jgi:hypothetical protein